MILSTFSIIPLKAHSVLFLQFNRSFLINSISFWDFLQKCDVK